MKKLTKLRRCLCGLSMFLVLAGCGSSGGGDGIPDTDSVTRGVAVDPYIVGAVFQEVASDGTVLQRESTPSNASGLFNFPKPVKNGSTIELKVSQRGLHGGSPFQGMLRREVNGNDFLQVNVTPLTTMLANGSTEEDLLMILDEAGFTGLAAADLYADPMAGHEGGSTSSLMNMTTVDDNSLLLLQANMAMNDYMTISGNYRATTDDLDNYEQLGILRGVAGALKSRLNAAEFDRIRTELEQGPQGGVQPTLGHLILAVLEQQQTLVELVREDMKNRGGFDPAVVERTVDNGRQQLAELVKTHMSPAPNNGAMLYKENCAMCHNGLATSTKTNRTATQIQAAIDNDIGGMRYLDTLSPAEIQAIAEALSAASGPAPDPTAPPDGAALYDTKCSGCHGALANTGKPGRTVSQIQAAIDNNMGNMGYLGTLTVAEVQAIAEALPAASAPDPATPPDGVALYNSECAGCHQPLANTSKPGRTAAQIQAAIDNNVGNMGYLGTLTADEIQAIANALPAAPAPDPSTPPEGSSLYSTNCAGCHGQLAATTKPGRSAAEIQAAIDNNVGNMGYLSTLTTAEVQAIADALPTAPAPDPSTPPDGAALYGTNCAGCHGTLATTTKPGRTAGQIQTAIDSNIGNMGYLDILTTAEVQAIADALPQGADPGPDYSDCTACHGQPPSGNSFPDTDGAHSVHKSLPSVTDNCAVCHADADHNGQLDFGITTAYDAKNASAVNNGDGTCSSISCHGGKTTPVWDSGSIAVNSQCSSCHSYGTSRYNSYYSGRHSKHLNKGYSCTVCHNTGKLATGHFSNLETAAFEQDPADTIGGNGTSVGLYQAGTCSNIACHGSENW